MLKIRKSHVLIVSVLAPILMLVALIGLAAGDGLGRVLFSSITTPTPDYYRETISYDHMYNLYNVLNYVEIRNKIAWMTPGEVVTVGRYCDTHDSSVFLLKRLWGNTLQYSVDLTTWWRYKPGQKIEAQVVAVAESMDIINVFAYLENQACPEWQEN